MVSRASSSKAGPKKARAGSPAKKLSTSAGKAKAGAEAKPKPNASRSAARKPTRVRLLAGGNPQIGKADGDAPVRAYIAALPGWKRDVARRLDALIARAVPNVQKAVKWNSPFYGIDGKGWFLGMHAYTHYIKLAFFRGAALRPPPPGASKQRETRYLDVRESDEIDEAALAKWLKQAAKLPGFIP